MTATVVGFLSGAISLGFFVCALFFLKFWHRTEDRLFLAFGVAFALLGAGQTLQVFANIAEEEQGYIYLIRLAAFSTILLAIVRKNRGTL